MDTLRPRWVRLTTTYAVTQPPPWTEGRYIASFSPEYESFWYWTGGWEPLGRDSLRIDWIRTGDWYEYRVELRADTLRGTGTATTDIGESRSFAVKAGAVECDTGPQFVDTIDDLYRDPEDRTFFMLRQLRRLIGEYRDSIGQLPAELGDVLDPSLAPQYRRMALHDAWDVAFSYMQDGDELEVRSAGPDKLFGTSDDLVERWVP